MKIDATTVPLEHVEAEEEVHVLVAESLFVVHHGYCNLKYNSANFHLGKVYLIVMRSERSKENGWDSGHDDR